MTYANGGQLNTTIHNTELNYCKKCQLWTYSAFLATCSAVRHSRANKAAWAPWFEFQL